MRKKIESFGKKFKRIRRQFAASRNAIEETFLDGNGNAVIEIEPGDDHPLFEELAPKDRADVSSDIYEYIEKKAYYIPINFHLIIRFHGRSIPAEDRDRIAEKIKNHYFYEIIDKADDLHTNMLKTIALGVLGAALISLYLFLAIQMENALFLELLSVVGTFAAWESVDYFIIERTGIKREIVELIQLTEATVDFCEQDRMNNTEVSDEKS